MEKKSYDYFEKNRRRREGKKTGTVGERIYAKGYRKKVNGKFGKESEAFQRICIIGTMGEVSRKANKAPSYVNVEK